MEVKILNPIKNLKNGLVKENPIFFQLLGMCPTLAVTTSASNGMGMGLATTAVLVCSNTVISLLRKFIPSKIRIPVFIVVIASFVTIVGMLMEGYVPALFNTLGLFIPLIVVNCLILARAEAYASKNGVLGSAFDGIGMGLGFTWALTLLGSIRELLGAGSIFGFNVFGASFKPALIMILPPGAFLALGILLAINNVIKSKNK
ncbi:electron transport complex protein RnfE [Caminicella sporogenes DSM 14501]|uniref:Ion-translocating oxidoreductase complex subunit E n=1 Tax=Caminicella sporogenes DSM 14501 TaxID=1121266 RepID=A0A1M6LX94_9FIRM|nr:electron transport complex protein RnfE [Caminicella sporogenes DSM 14501]